MPVHGGPIFADANTIIEAHRVRCWGALASRFHLETVEKCFEETQTGAQNRRPEENIDPQPLRSSLRAVQPVSPVQLAEVDLRGGAILDAGERALWAHALTRADPWLVCGPDTASVKFGFEQGHRFRLVSLGELLSAIGHRPAIQLRRNYEKAWLDTVIHRLVMGLL